MRRGRKIEAMKVLVDNHCGGNKDDPLAAFEFREIEETLELERISNHSGWLDLFRTRGNRWRTWISVSVSIASQSSGQTLVGYYLAVILTGVGITSPRTQSIINGCLTMWNMGLAFFGAAIIDKAGRRPMMLTSLSGMLIFGMIPWTICAAIYQTHGTAGAGYAVIAFIFLFNGFYATTW